MKTLLSIDLSTNATGYALFNIETNELITYGVVKGKSFKDTSKWRATLKKMRFMADSVLNLIENYKPHAIVIEEIAGSKNRIGQKTLDMVHGMVWSAIDKYLDIVSYYDVSGLDGWRTHLQLKQSDADKAQNKEAKKLNPKLGKGIPKLPLVDTKTLSARYANKRFNLSLDPENITTDGDIADAVSMGDSFLRFRFTSPTPAR